MTQHFYDSINTNQHKYNVNWKFYIDNDNIYCKQYAYQHIIDLLNKDCHSVFQVDENTKKVNWVGYTCDDEDNKFRRNMLIENPSFILKKVTCDTSVYITLGNNIFRFFVIKQLSEDPPFYELIDYEKAEGQAYKAFKDSKDRKEFRDEILPYICKICNKSKSDIIDGICDVCEPMWLDRVERYSRAMPSDTPLQDIFEIAIDTLRFNLNRKKT